MIGKIQKKENKSSLRKKYNQHTSSKIQTFDLSPKNLQESQVNELCTLHVLNNFIH